MAIIRDEEIEGKRVILEDASDVGSIVDIYVDTTDWRITQLDVKLEKRYAERMGLETALLKKTVIPVKIHFLKSVGDVVHLKGTIEDLSKSQKTILPPTDSGKGKEKSKTPAPPPAKDATKPPPKPPAGRTPPGDEKRPTKL
jgi:sporulation protein YlmC with PRC-barrel domain